MDKSAEQFKKFAVNFKSFLANKGIGTTLLLGAGFIAGEKFIDLLIQVVAKQYHIYKSKEYFEEMLKAHPQLKKFTPEDVAKYFNSLNHFAPNMAKDPLTAGAYITQSLQKLSDEELGGPPPDTVSTLTDIEKKISDAKGGRSKGSVVYESALGNIGSNFID